MPGAPRLLVLLFNDPPKKQELFAVSKKLFELRRQHKNIKYFITTYCNVSTSATFSGKEWVNPEIEIRENEKIIHRIKGRKVLEYSKPQLDEVDAFARQLLAEGASRDAQ